MSDSTKLRDPKGPFQVLLRRLADEAMSVTHHDASFNEEGYVNEVRLMERRFGHIIRGYLAARSRSAARPSSPTTGGEDDAVREA